MEFQENKPFKPFRFLDLAPEIRQKIYELVATSPESPINFSSPFAHAHFPHAFLLTSSQIYHELRPYYFKVNTFSITVLRRNETWDYLLTPAFLDYRMQIRSLRIIVVRWGQWGFFCRQLIPALEDCILKGKLRELEVVIRDTSLDAASLLPGVHKEQGGNYDQNWRMLGKLLRDPYLEKASLKAGRVQLSTKERQDQNWDWELEKCKDITWMIGKPGLRHV